MTEDDEHIKEMRKTMNSIDKRNAELELATQSEEQQIIHKKYAEYMYALYNRVIQEKKFSQEIINDTAKWVIEQFKIITLKETDVIYRYEWGDGIYVPDGEILVKTELEKYFQHKCTTATVNEILNKIRRLTYKPLSLFTENNKKLLCLKNGVWSLEERRLHPHSPSYYFINRIPVIYNPTARCENITRFFNSIVKEEHVETLYEIVGFCMMPEYKIQKAILLVGSGRNGKSVFLNMLKTFIGKENVSNQSIQRLSKDKFSSFNLFGKIANIFPDLSSEEIEDTSTFKTLTSGLDSIAAEQKFKDQFSFINNAKLLFSCNQIPKVRDASDAFFRRWIILTFPYIFEGVADNKELISELTTDEELSGLLNIAIEYYHKLEMDGEFSTHQSVDEIREIYTRLSDPVGSFILDKIAITPEEYIPKDEVYNVFIAYCREHKFPAMSEKMFSSIIFGKLPVTNFRTTIERNGKMDRPMCWRGIGWKALEEGEDVRNEKLGG